MLLLKKKYSKSKFESGRKRSVLTCVMCSIKLKYLTILEGFYNSKKSITSFRSKVMYIYDLLQSYVFLFVPLALTLTIYFNLLNYWLSQKFKLLKNGKFNYLIIYF